MGLSMRNLGSRLMPNIRSSFLRKLAQPSLDELNMTHFHVTPFIYHFQDRGQCPALLLRMSSESF